jgi:hypothetical protein
VGGFPKEPANNPQSLRVKPLKYRNSLSFAGSLQVTVILFLINVLINPQTTCKLPANVNSGLPNAVNVLTLPLSILVIINLGLYDRYKE